MKIIKKYYLSFFASILLLACHSQNNANKLMVKKFGNPEDKINISNKILKCDLKYIIEPAAFSSMIYLYISNLSKDTATIENFVVNMKWEQNDKPIYCPYLINRLRIIINNKNKQVTDTVLSNFSNLDKKLLSLPNKEYSLIYEIEFSSPNYSNIPDSIDAIVLNVKFDVKNKSKITHHDKTLRIPSFKEYLELPVGRND